jgi:hypothetical protein
MNPIFVQTSAATNLFQSDYREQVYRTQHALPLYHSDFKVRTLSTLSLRPLISFIKSLVVPVNADESSFLSRFQHALAPLLLQLMILGQPKQTLYPFNSEILSLMGGSLSRGVMDQLHDIHPTVFPLSHLWISKYAADEKNYVYDNVAEVVHNPDVIAVGRGSDNIGTSSHGRRVETTTLWQRTIFKHDIPELLKNSNRALLKIILFR